MAETNPTEGVEVSQTATVDSALFNGSSNDVITFASGSLAGDYVDIICDGSLWFVSGMAAVVAGIGSSDS